MPNFVGGADESLLQTATTVSNDVLSVIMRGAGFCNAFHTFPLHGHIHRSLHAFRSSFPISFRSKAQVGTYRLLSVSLYSVLLPCKYFFPLFLG